MFLTVCIFKEYFNFVFWFLQSLRSSFPKSVFSLEMIQRIDSNDWKNTIGPNIEWNYVENL